MRIGNGATVSIKAIREASLQYGARYLDLGMFILFQTFVEI